MNKGHESRYVSKINPVCPETRTVKMITIITIVLCEVNLHASVICDSVRNLSVSRCCKPRRIDHLDCIVFSPN
jgi:hypothetical protein